MVRSGAAVTQQVTGTIIESRHMGQSAGVKTENRLYAIRRSNANTKALLTAIGSRCSEIKLPATHRPTIHISRLVSAKANFLIGHMQRRTIECAFFYRNLLHRVRLRNFSLYRLFAPALSLTSVTITGLSIWPTVIIGVVVALVIIP